MEINRIGTLGANQYPSTQKTEQDERENLTAEDKVAMKPVTGAAVAAPPPSGEGAQGSSNAASQQAAVQQTTSGDAAALEGLSTSDDDDDSDYQSIVSKVNSGQQLTSSELSTLRSRNPALYAQAVQAQGQRSELRAAMEENPAQAFRMAQDALAEVGESDEDLAAVHKALQAEYQQFATKYDHVELSRRQYQPLLAEDEV